MIPIVENVYNLNLIFSTRIKDFTQLKQYTFLTKLNISFNPIKDISFLSCLLNLQVFIMEGNRFVQDITPVKNCTQMITLNLSTCTEIKEFDSIGYLYRLCNLNLSNCIYLDDVTFLEGLKDLKNALT